MGISASAAVVMVAQTGEVVYEHNAHKRLSMASTTKIMTAILALEESSGEELVTVSANASSQEGSSIYLKTGEQVEMEDLVFGMMLNSGNDAACAVAEHIGGTSDVFAQMMTNKAKEIGAQNTSFKNANGLDAEGHYSTAYDMAVITAYGLKNENFKKIVSTKNAQIDNGETITYLRNHNKLLWNYDGCIGVKTGYTKKTGRCLVSAAEKDGVTLIAVTLNAPNDWEDHKKMLDYGFENVKKQLVVGKGEILKEFNIDKCIFNAVSEDDVYISSKNNAKSESQIILHTIKQPNFNIIKGEKIGYADILYDGKLIKTVNLVADRDFCIKENTNIGFFNHLIEIMKNLLLKY